MLAAILVVSRLLGLISGQHPLPLQVAPEVRKIEILRDGKVVETLNGEPWNATIDLGTELEPQELTVVAYDEKGNELARDTQNVNLPRPPAEAFIDLDKSGSRMKATVRWQHINGEKPMYLALRLDGKKISKGDTTVTLPSIDMNAMHVLDAEIGFPGDVVAKKELVFGGLYADEEPTELTGIIARQSGEGAADPTNCFHIDGKPVDARGIEKGEALVIVVRGSGFVNTRKALAVPRKLQDATPASDFDLADAKMRLIFPTPRTFQMGKNEPVVNLFDKTRLYDGDQGLFWLLTNVGGPEPDWPRIADAVAVAGVQAMVDARRRAVVVLLDEPIDLSHHKGIAVRRYLERIGVPLYVWSLRGTTPALASDWGTVTDVSSYDKLRAATRELRDDLDRQRVVWLRTGPLEALRAEAKGCALQPIVHP
ncbi:MAG: hypothetical protein JO197_20255 [Acidobacteria bacterium]|nr:hypothetical protein [Acidobacteriota bacterium]MBV9474566.1 hypothetical protein [Acidobacteriota bacterium]